jgi:hypothetical protein
VNEAALFANYTRWEEGESLDGKYVKFVYAGRRTPVKIYINAARSHHNKSSSPQEDAFDIPVHASSSANTHLKKEYEPLTVISIKKKATQTYPTNRQNTTSALVQGNPIFS